jgi:hypothetical protein
MALNLRLALTIFTIGFAAEVAGGVYLALRSVLPVSNSGFLLLLNPAFTLIALLFLWIGRHEWSELHENRVRHAHWAFALSILFFALAAVPVALPVAFPSVTLPAWFQFEFAVAIAGTFALTFVTYALVVTHLTGIGGKFLVVLAVGWGTFIAFQIGVVLSNQLPTITQLALARSLSVTAIATSITAQEVYLTVTYFLLLVAYVDAHRNVAAGHPPPRPLVPAG